MAADFLTRFAAALKRPANSIDRSMAIKDLGVDSFDLVDLLVRLQEEMDVRIFQEDLAGVQTIGDLEKVFEQRRTT